MNDKARSNFESLSRKSYPGRGLVMGMDDSGEGLIQIYWIMGRSANSRNRVFRSEKGRVWTEAADESKVEDPSLIIYNAMDELDRIFIASNGDQTDTIVSAVRVEALFQQSLMGRTYEPDSPNFTPRIAGMATLHKGPPLIEMAILKRAPDDSGACARCFFVYESIKPGYGFGLTTYVDDGDPLPPFEGDPMLLPLEGDINAIASTYWGALNEDNRISLAVKRIDIESAESTLEIINQYVKA